MKNHTDVIVARCSQEFRQDRRLPVDAEDQRGKSYAADAPTVLPNLSAESSPDNRTAPGGSQGRFCLSDQLKESPQAQEDVAFGLSIVKPCFSMVSTKSMVAPSRYGALIRSVTTFTPP